MPTFDFSSGVITADNDPNSGTPTNTASQKIGSDTLTVTVDAASTAYLVVMDEQDFFSGDIPNLSGNALETTFDAFANSMTLTLDNGKVFDLTNLKIIDEAGNKTNFTFTTSKGDVTVVVDSSQNEAVPLTFTDAKLQGVAWVKITQQGPGPNMLTGLDDVVLTNIHAPNTAPTFVSTNTPMLVAQNGVSAAGVLGDLLHVSDVDSAQTETWSQSVAPGHGTLSFTSTTANSGSADITSGGSMSYTPTAGFAGTDTFTVKVSDGTDFVTRQITVNVGPATPGAPDLTAGADTGAALFSNRSTDNITGAASLSFSGTSAANDSTSTVRVFLDKNGNTTYDGTDPTATATLSNGSWTVSGLSTTGLSDGDYNVYALVKSSDATLTSATSTALVVHIDKTAPTQTVGSLALSADTGAGGDFITKTAAQTVSATLSGALGGGEYLYGSLDNGNTWVDISSKVSGTAVSWNGVTLSGNDTLKLKVVDTAGNDGAVASQAYVLDTTAPSQPSMPDMTPGTDTGASSSDNLTDDTTPTFNGTGEVGSTVKLYDTDGTTEVGTAVVNGAGKWTSTTSTLSGGSHTITAKAFDVAGNVSTASNGLTIDIHTVNTAPGGAVSISGTATDGQTLTASNTLTDADGLGTISYQWKSDGADIAGATASTLVLASAQVGHAITVVASYTDGFNQAESVASSATSLVSALNNAPGGAVSITGTATQGQTLTASNTLTDADGLGTISYQWKSDGANIAGATASTLTLAQAQVGHAITVVASYTDGLSKAESVASTATGSVANINDAPSGAVSITGTATQGQTLTASNTLTDADGLGTISYQWKSDGANIAGATASTLTLAQAQVGHAITVVASYTDGFSHAEAVASTATGSVANINDAPGGAVSITGTATQGQTLTASNTLTDADGLGTISYQWKSDGANIAGATASTLTLAQAQVGHAITVVASYTDGFSHAETMASTATGSVGNINDAPTGALVISGSAEVGAVLTASTAGLVDLDGLGAFSYVWKADGTTIGGATAANFTLTSGQLGKAITVTVSYTDGFSHAESVVSAATGAVQPEPPPVVLPPPLPVVIAAAGDAVGVDTSSPKVTAPTVVLPNGASVVNPVFAAVEQAKVISAQLTAGTITTVQATELLINLATPTQVVAHETYNFFTGTPPTAAGFTYLVDSPTNPTDLTDVYYAGFNTLNRFINFAVNLGSIGDGKSDFQASYGALTFAQAVSKAYDAVIGDQSTRGFDPVASKAYVLSQLPYFMALGGGELGAKAAMVGYLLGVGAAEHLGPYYQAAHDYVAPQIQLVTSAAAPVADFV